MKRDVIIMAKAPKGEYFCVAGIDVDSGEWIRLISDNTDLKYAAKKDLICEDNDEVRVLDKVTIELEKVDKWEHPETYLLNSDYFIRYKPKKDSNKEDIEKYIEDRDILFFNYNNSIGEKELKGYKNEIYSLSFIRVNYLKLVKLVEYKNDKNQYLIGNVKYKDRWYNNILIMDKKLVDKYKKGELFLGDVKVVMGLGNNYKGQYNKAIIGFIE